MWIRPAVLVCFLVVGGPAAARGGAPASPDSLLSNSSFERLVPGAVGKDVGQGTWTLGGDGRVPDGWSLNLGYPGTLEVVSEPVHTGAHALRLTSGAARDAHVFQACPALRPGAWYRVSVRVRGGTGTLLVYEYAGGRQVASHLMEGAAAPAGSWRTLTGYYAPGVEDFDSASIALAVPKEGTVVFDDVVVEKLESKPPDARARAITLDNDAVELTVSAGGRLLSMREKASGTERADTGALQPILVAVRDGVEVPVSEINRRGSTWVARFAEPDISVKLRVNARPLWFEFEVTDVKPKDLDGLALRFPIQPLRTSDMWMPGTYDDTFGVTHMGLTPNTEVHYVREGAVAGLEARWQAALGMRGGSSVLLAAPWAGFLEAIRQMEVATGLPSPMLHSGAPGATGALEWGRLSTAVRRSYLFATYLAPGHLDTLIEAAKLGGFGLILLHRASWRATGGHETIATEAFPRGLPDLVAACDRIHAAGLGVGLHLYGPAVSLDDAYATPIPDKRLFALDLTTLAQKADADAAELVLANAPRLPLTAAPDVYPGDLLRLGDEIIRWRAWVPGSPPRIVGCERGALGTVPAAHRKGAAVTTLVRRNGGLLVDPDSTLPAEMGEHLARVVNACRADLVYFDAAEGAPPGQQPPAWYYLNKVLLASCAGFDHGVLVQTGVGPGRQLLWHLVPRSASADGHGDLKRYLDERMVAIQQFRKTHVAADIGWYALDLHGTPDELEYVCAKALGMDASVSVQAHKPLLESHPRAREVLEMIARWEQRRLADDVPAPLRASLLGKGRDVQLFEVDDTWQLWEAVYTPRHPLAAVGPDDGGCEVRNDRPDPVALGLEIERHAIATTPAAHEAADAVEITDFTALERYGDATDATLREHILGGGRALMADGLARRGVPSTLTAGTGAPAGLPSARFAVDSTIRGAGWAFTGRRFEPALDIGPAAALGLWVRGDGHGETLALGLFDAEGHAAWGRIALDYVGWRFQGLPLRVAQAFDRSRIAHVVFGLEHIPPESSVAVEVAALRAVPRLHVPSPMAGLSVHVGGRTVTLPVALEPGQCLTIDPLGRAVHWPGGLAPGRRIDLGPGGPLLLGPGAGVVGIRLREAAGYAGDLSVRVRRAWKLGEGPR